jgi:peptidyl-prolyl cis-trans isomerase D
MLKHFRSGSKRIRTLWWILTIGTVVTFIGGFIFIFGSGAGDIGRAMQATPDQVGKVGDEPLRQQDLAGAMNVAAATYENQYGTQAQGNDAALVREQAWTNLVAERAVDRLARRYGMGVSDPEIVYAARNSPPPDITLNPAFMTNGRFDRTKWQQALADPNVDWSPLEERMRKVLPAQRLEERVIAGVKISEPELQRLFATQYDRAKASYVLLPLDGAVLDSSKLSDAVLQKYYDEHKTEFSTPTQVQAELVQVPLTVGGDEEGIARADAEDIVRRARAGEDFAQLARDLSEGPYADRGGDMGQDVAMSRLPPTLQPAIERLSPGEVADPIRDGNTYFVFKLISRGSPAGAETMVRLAQIQKPIRPNSESMQKDVEGIRKLRADGARQKLADLAAKRQLVSVNTGWFAQGQYVPQLLQLPQVQQWALQAKKGEVSRAYGSETGWLLVQVTDRREAGPRPFAEAKDDVRRAVEIQLRQQKPMADAERILAAVKAGQTLEQAATAAGAMIAVTDTFARSQPDPRLSPAPRAVGLAFGLPVGKVGGPVAAPTGVYLVRKDLFVPGNPAVYEQIKGQLSSQLLQARQQRWLRGWIEKTVSETKVEDLRNDVENTL